MKQATADKKQTNDNQSERTPDSTRARETTISTQIGFGNQALLRMSQGTASRVPSITPLRPSQAGLQRKCACDDISLKTTGLQLQPKLTVGSPTDEYEREADRVAEQVMRMPKPVHASSAATGSDDNNHAEHKRANSNSEQRGYRYARRGNQAFASDGLASPIMSQMISELRQSLGQPLDAATRGFMEPRFETDFGDIRLHIDERAKALAASLDADAFAIGHDIAFAAGRYASGSAGGNRLLAHELAHVIQQRNTGIAAIALQPAGDLLDQTKRVREKLSNEATKANFKTSLNDASDLADQLLAAFKIATGPKPPQGALSEDKAREGLTNIIRGLITLASNQTLSSEEQKMSFNKAKEIAIKSQDSDIQDILVSQVVSVPAFQGINGLMLLGSLTGHTLPQIGKNENEAQWLNKNTPEIGKIFKALDDQRRQDFSRKLKWGPSDFSDEKFSWRLLPSAARVRPAPAAAHNFPSVRCAPLACANDLTPCRDGLAF